MEQRKTGEADEERPKTPTVEVRINKAPAPAGGRRGGLSRAESSEEEEDGDDELPAVDLLPWEAIRRAALRRMKEGSPHAPTPLLNVGRPGEAVGQGDASNKSSTF